MKKMSHVNQKITIRSQKNSSAIALGYAAVGSLWILLSDRLAHHFFSHTPYYPFIQTGKGWLYVLVTSLALWSLIRSALKQKDSLIQLNMDKGRELERIHHELQHRVKNNLQLMLSLINLQQDEYAHSPKARQALVSTYIRFEAISIAYEEMYSQHRTTDIETANYFQRLAEDITEQYLDQSKEFCWDLSVDPSPVSVEKLIPLGLILTELSSACMEHKPSSVSVVFDVEIQCIETRLRFIFCPIGIASNILENQGNRNLHGILIDGLSSQLDGDLSIEVEEHFKATLEIEL